MNDTAVDTPQPSKSRFALWQAAAPGFSVGSFVVPVSDVTTVGGSSFVDTDIPADATQGQAHAVTVSTGANCPKNGMPFIYPARRTVIRGTITFNVNVIAGAANFYIGAGNVTGADPLTGDFIGIGVQKVSNVGQGTWQLFTSVGGAFTATGTSVPIVYRQRYTFEIVLDKGVCTLSINGAFACSTSSTLPVADCSEKDLHAQRYHPRGQR